jgi:hypothetical protein
LSRGAISKDTGEDVKEVSKAAGELRDDDSGDLFEFVNDGAVFDGVEELDGVLEEGADGLEDVAWNGEDEADEAEDVVGDLFREVFDQDRDFAGLDLADEAVGFVFVGFEDLDDLAGDLVEEAEDASGAEETE